MRFHVVLVAGIFYFSGLLIASAQIPDENLGRVSPLLAPTGDSTTSSLTPQPRSKGNPAFSLIYEMSVSPDPAMRMRALEAWGDSDAEEALTQVLNGLLDSDSRVRDVATSELANFGSKRVFDFIMGLLISGDSYSVAMLNNALPAMKNQLEDQFLVVFRDEGQDIAYRRAAAYALGRMGSQDASELLAQGCWSEYPEFAYTCAEALYNVRDSNSLKTWRALLGHENGTIRRFAVYGICTTGSLEALGILREICIQQIPLDPQLQVEAARCISAWPAMDAIPVLIESMHANRNVSAVCTLQLTERSGMELGENPELWLAWWQEITAPPPPPSTDDALLSP